MNVIKVYTFVCLLRCIYRIIIGVKICIGHISEWEMTMTFKTTQA